MQFYRFHEEIGDFDVFVRGCLELLENVRIITRKDVLESLKKNLDEVERRCETGFTDVQLCNIGNLQDGSVNISYQINDLNEVYRQIREKTSLSVCKLEELTPQDVKPVIVFIEDAFSSATQITSIFETYMGSKERTLSEVHVKELSSDMKEKLCKSRVFFSFIFFNKENEEKFISRLKDLGITDVQLLAYEAFPEGYFKRSDVKDRDAWEITKKYFEAAGKMLIREKAFKNGVQKTNWDDKRIQTSILGYDDAQRLIVFPWNTPTYTLTALWMGSKNNNWYPLFQRIDKP